MEYNDNTNKIDNTVEELIDLYNENVYTNNNNEVTAIMVNESLNKTAEKLGELFKNFVSINCIVKAYRNITLQRDNINPNKSTIVNSSTNGWLIRVDIPKFINFFHFGEYSSITASHSILTLTSGLNNYTEGSINFSVYAETYNNVTWAQDEQIWGGEIEIDIVNPTREFTLLFFVEQQDNFGIVPDLGIGNPDEYYWETGPMPKEILNNITYPNGTPDIINLDFPLIEILTELYNDVFPS